MKNVYSKLAGATLAFSALVALILTLASGCVAPGGGGPAIITNTNTVNTVSNYMAIAVWEATAYGMRSDSNTTTMVGNAVAASISEVTGGGDFSPGALDAALQKLPLKILQTPAAGILISTVETVYQLYWASDVQGAVNGEYAAKSYLGAFVFGIRQGTSGRPSPISPLMVKKPAPKLIRR